jgi:hypothetical protein
MEECGERRQSTTMGAALGTANDGGCVLSHDMGSLMCLSKADLHSFIIAPAIVAAAVRIRPY